MKPPAVSRCLVAILLVSLSGSASGDELTFQGRPVGAWTTDLQSQDVELRRATAKKLGTLAPGVHELIPALARAIRDEDEGVREAAMGSLSFLASRYDEALGRMLAALDEGDCGLRLLALRGILGIWISSRYTGQPPLPKSRKVYQAIARRLEDEAPEIREAAAEALGRLQPALREPREDYLETVSSPLLAALRDNDPRVRRAAVQAVAALGAKIAVPALRAVLEDEDLLTRQLAIITLAPLDPRPGETIRKLAPLLAAEGPDIREKTLDAIESFRVKVFLTSGEAYRRTIDADRAALEPALRTLLESKDSSTRRRAVALLVEMRRAGEAVVRELTDVMGSDQHGDFEWATTQLAAMGEEALPAIPFLIDTAIGNMKRWEGIKAVLKASGPRGAELAIETILEPILEGHPARDDTLDLLRALSPEQVGGAARTLIASLETGNLEASSAVYGALQKLGPRPRTGGIPALLRGLESPDPGTRAWNVWALAPAARDDEWIRSRLEAAKQDPDPRVRRIADDSLVWWVPSRPDSLPEVPRIPRDGSPAEIEGALQSAIRLRSKAADLLPDILALLDRPEERVVRGAVNALGALGEVAQESLPTLVKMMRKGEPLPGIQIEPSIRSIGRQSGRPIPELLDALEDEDPAVRRLAAYSLGLLGDTASWAAPALADVLQDGERNVRIEAALALLAVDPRQPGIRGILIDAASAPQGWNPLRSRRYSAWQEGQKTLPQALEKLSELPPGEPQPVAALLGSGNTQFKRWALRELGRSGPAARSQIPHILEELHDKDPSIRELAVEALGLIGDGGSETQAAILRCLDDEQAAVRVAAVSSLGMLGLDADRLVPAMLAGLQDPSEGVVAAAADTLGTLGEKAEAAVGALLETAVRPGNGQGAAAARSSLWSIDPGGARIVPALLEAMTDPERRTGAEEALRLIGPEAASTRGALLKALRSPDAGLRAVAASCLGRLGPEARPAIPALIRSLRDPDDTVAAAAKAALRMTGIER